jgi:transposase-like protein
MEFITENVVSSLYPYQIENIERQIIDYQSLNMAEKKNNFYMCPKCGAVHPRLIKGGMSHSGKQMYRCKECDKRFTYDNGHLTWYSHQPYDKWSMFIKSTLEHGSLLTNSALIDVSPSTAFRMRHKFLSFLSLITEEKTIDKAVEIDEKVFMESHKGYRLSNVKGRKRQMPAAGGAYSHQFVSLICGADRENGSYIQAYSMGHPTIKDATLFGKHISDNIFAWTDGQNCYTKMLCDKRCPFKILTDHKEYDSENHLNTVNSLHSRMAEWYRNYRGVATVYINRYAALFSIWQQYAGCDLQEIILKLIQKISKYMHYFFVRDIRDKDIFEDPTAIYERKGMADHFINPFDGSIGDSTEYWTF